MTRNKWLSKFMRISKFTDRRVNARCSDFSRFPNFNRTKVNKGTRQIQGVRTLESLDILSYCQIFSFSSGQFSPFWIFNSKVLAPQRYSTPAKKKI